MLISAGIYRSECPARIGDFVEFFAEIDVLFALSNCPSGDETVFGWGAEAMKRMEATCHPLKIEVYELLDGEILKDWKSPEPPEYKWRSDR
jgi:uncharacterized protein YcgI (DUF1989 family)